jgi:hypothetical protein
MELAMKRKGSRQTLIIWEGREGGREGESESEKWWCFHDTIMCSKF